MITSIADLRREYSLRGLRRADLALEPITQFTLWLNDALDAGLPEPNAMTLATVSSEGFPSARTVLLKAADSRGFVFFTNYDSRKSQELSANPNACIVFHWNGLERQVIARGQIAKTSLAESAEYFSVRPRGSQLGAWASRQSATVASREQLEAALAEVTERFGEGPIPLPPFWGGFILKPETVEFWQGRRNRLHDRLQYQRTGDSWNVERLSP